VTVAVAVGVGLFALGLSVSGVRTRLGSASPARHGSAVLGDFLVATVAVVGFVALAYFLRTQRRRKRDEADWFYKKLRVRLRWRVAIAVFVFAALVASILAVASFLYGHAPSSLVVRGITAHAHARAGVPRAGFHAHVHRGAVPVHVFWTILVIVEAAAVVAVIVFVLLRKRLAWALRAKPDSGEAATELTQAVAVGMDDPSAERDPRRAVIKAYARMESAFGESGVRRRASEAPVEYLERALPEVRVSGGSVSRLTALFERARFSHHEIGEPMRRQALAALRHVQGELEGKR
jgi:Domain of unknown function (DUF4129)